MGWLKRVRNGQELMFDDVGLDAATEFVASVLRVYRSECKRDPKAVEWETLLELALSTSEWQPPGTQRSLDCTVQVSVREKKRGGRPRAGDWFLAGIGDRTYAVGHVLGFANWGMMVEFYRHTVRKRLSPADLADVKNDGVLFYSYSSGDYLRSGKWQTFHNDAKEPGRFEFPEMLDENWEKPFQMDVVRGDVAVRAATDREIRTLPKSSTCQDRDLQIRIKEEVRAHAGGEKPSPPASGRWFIRYREDWIARTRGRAAILKLKDGGRQLGSISSMSPPQIKFKLENGRLCTYAFDEVQWIHFNVRSKQGPRS